MEHSRRLKIVRQMKPPIACWLPWTLLLSVTCGCLGWQPASGEEPLLVGAAQIDITPPIGYRAAGGYSEVISTNVHDPLFCKALVLGQGDLRAVIVMTDLLSVPFPLSGQIRSEIAHSTGIPQSNIIIAATHNHGSPEYYGVLRDLNHAAALAELGSDPHESVDYPARLQAACLAAVAAAALNAQQVDLELLSAMQPDLAFNRRFHMRDGSVQFNPGVGNPEILRPAGPVDEALPVLLFRDATHGRPIAALTTFAMHTAVAGGHEFSADFPSVLQRQLRDHFEHKDGHELDRFVSIFAEGTAGDINHIDVNNPRQLSGPAESQRIGKTLAGTIVLALDSAVKLAEPSLAVASHTAYAPFPAVSPARYEHALQLLRHQNTDHQPFLTLVAAWRDCLRHEHAERYPELRKPLEVQAIRLDANTAIVTLPHEVFVETGLAIKAASPFRHTIVISLANDVDYYLPTRRAFEEGSYEIETCPLHPGCAEILFDDARRVLAQVKVANR